MENVLTPSSQAKEDQVRQRRFINYPNIHRILRFCSKFWNNAERNSALTWSNSISFWIPWYPCSFSMYYLRSICFSMHYLIDIFVLCMFVCFIMIEIVHLVCMQNFPEVNISYSLICTCTCEYQEVRNVSFSENFAFVLNEWPHS